VPTPTDDQCLKLTDGQCLKLTEGQWLKLPDSQCQKLTDAGRGEKPDTLVRRLTLWEEELDGVLGKGERHNGHGAGAHYQALGPQAHKPHKRAQGVQNVGVITTRLSTTRCTYGMYYVLKEVVRAKLSTNIWRLMGDNHYERFSTTKIRFGRYGYFCSCMIKVLSSTFLTALLLYICSAGTF